MTEQTKKPIRYLDGAFRGTTYADNIFDSKILRSLYRRGDFLRSEGRLAAYVDSSYTDDKFKAAIDRLERYGFILVSPGAQHGGRHIRLLAVEEASALCWQDEAKARGPEDHKQMLAYKNLWFLDDNGNPTPTSKEFAKQAEELGMKRPVKLSDFLAEQKGNE